MSNKDKQNISYNNQSYIQHLSFMRLGDDGYVDSSKAKYEYLVDNDKVHKISFVSDITFPCFRGSFIVNDVGDSFMHRIIADGYTMCFFKLQRIDRTEIVSELKHQFVVTDVEMIDKMAKTYKVNIMSFDWYKFNNYTLYSSNKDKTYTKILQEILKASDIKINPKFVDSDNTGFFLTQTSFTLLDSIKFLLKRTFSPELGLFFLIFDLVTSKYNIINLNEKIKNITEQREEHAAANIFFVSDSTEMGSIRNNMMGITIKNYQGFQKMMEVVKETDIASFDYEKMEWTHEKLTRKKINDSFPKLQRNDLKTMYKNFPKFENNGSSRNTVESIDLRYSKYDAMKETFLLSNVLIGTSQGDMTRNAGDFMFLKLGDLSPLYNKISGLWCASRVYHLFEDGQYKNEYHLCRSDYSRNLENV